MDDLRARIKDDLAGLISGELQFSPFAGAIYRADAGLAELEPLGVVFPRGEDDLLALARYATENAIPLHPRGAGTGASGGCLGPGIVVDLSRHFRRIVVEDGGRVSAEAGVVLDVLNASLAPEGRRVEPVGYGSESHTIGGLIAMARAGPRSPAFGTFGDRVEALRVVFGHGEAATLVRPGLHEIKPGRARIEDRGDSPIDAESFPSALSRRLEVLRSWHSEEIARHEGGWKAGRPGYDLDALAAPGGLDLIGPIVGSEGSLAIITRATIRTLPMPSARLAVVLPFGRLGDAARAVEAVSEARPSACLLYDWRTLSLSREAEPDLRSDLAEHAEAALVVEFAGIDPGGLAVSARQLASKMRRQGALSSAPAEVTRPEEIDRLLALPERVERLLRRPRDPSRPQHILERLRVPPRALPDLLTKIQAAMKARGVAWTLHALATLAEVRVRPFLNLADPADREAARGLAEELAGVTLDLGGTVIAGLVLGDARVGLIRRMQGRLAGAHRELKLAYDPAGLLNPGKVVGDESATASATIRAAPGRASPPGDDPQSGPIPAIRGIEPEPSSALLWPGRGRMEHVDACNSCGTCRSREPTMRMCPTFRASHDEATSPRSKVGLLRQIADGRLDPRAWGSEALREHADLCVHCNLCESECPSGVDVSALMLEAKAAYVAHHGLPPDAWMRSRVEVWSAWASRFPRLFNGLMGNRFARWIFERAFGLARLRALPRAHRTRFVRRAERLGLTRPDPGRPGPRAAYFVDVVADHFHQDLAATVVNVLRHAGVNVYVPRGQRGSGMPALAAGDFDRARLAVRRNLRALGDAARDGYTIVCSEPTAAMMLRREALRLSDDLDAELVAASTMDVGQYLAGLIARGDLRPPERSIAARVGYHQPCHLRVLGVGTPGLDLMRTIPGLEVEFIDRGCSGMAGTFGLASRHFRASLRAGRGLLRRLRAPEFDLGATECSACKLQMEGAVASKRTLHPIQFLAAGYGLESSLGLGSN